MHHNRIIAVIVSTLPLCKPVIKTGLYNENKIFCFRHESFTCFPYFILYFIKNAAAHAPIITISRRKETNITGSVTFGGCAARFNAKTGTFTLHTIIHKVKLLLAKNKMESNVRGNIIPICPKKLIPSQRKRLGSSLSHH